MRYPLGLLLLAIASALHAQDLNPYPLLNPPTSAARTPTEPTPAISSTSRSAINQVLDNQPPVSTAWVRAEYFMGIIRKPDLPPLIRSIRADTARTMTTTTGSNGPILYPSNEGSAKIDYNGFSGGRLESGLWLDENRGVEFVGVAFERRDQSSIFTNPVGASNFLSRFIIDANNLASTTLFADNANGPVGARGETKIDPVYSLELNYLGPGYSFLADRTNFLVGVRYFDMRETLQVDFGQRFTTGGSFSFTDRFLTTNQFYGANFGFKSQYFATNRIGAETTFKCAIGESHERAIIEGTTVIDIPGSPTVRLADGLYARPTNSGTHGRDFVTIIPEMNLRLTYAITPRTKIYLGYDLTYVSNVVRPGSVIDPVVYSGNLILLNPANQVMGPVTNRPAFRFEGVDTLLHQFSIGVSAEF